MGDIHPTLLHYKAQNYLKLAQTQLNLPFEEKVFDQSGQYKKEKDEYEAEEKMLPGSKIEDFYTFIERWSQSPHFRFGYVAEELAKDEFGIGPTPRRNIRDAIAYLKPQYNENDLFAKKLTIYLIEYYIEHFDPSILDYIKSIEHHDISDKHLRMAQGKLVKDIVDFATNNPTEDSYQASQKMLGELLDNSTKFNQQFLERLAKHLGIEYYGDLMGEKDRLVISRIMEKAELSIFDVATIISEYAYQLRLFTPDIFQKILNKADDRAKQYLRNFLYSSNGGVHFMLDEAFRPMNKDYKEMPWPATFHVFRGWQNVKPLNDVWGPIFADFQVVPNVWGAQAEAAASQNI